MFISVTFLLRVIVGEEGVGDPGPALCRSRH